MSTQPSSITIEPIVSYPREAEPGKTYLMTVDLRFKEEWPYDEEEHEIYCLLDSAPLFDNEELGESVIVLHRFGGTYGPAMFLLTANSVEMTEHLGAIKLTLANRQLMPLQVFKLDKIRVSTKSTTTSETVTITRQQVVASGSIRGEFKEQPSETPAPAETDLPQTETPSTVEAPVTSPLALPPGIKLRRTFSFPSSYGEPPTSPSLPINHIAWSPDGRTLALLTGAGYQICSLDAETGEVKRRLVTAFPVNCLVWSPDGSKLAQVFSRTISILEASSLGRSQEIAESNSNITDAQWSPDGRWLGVVTEESRIYLRNASDWTEHQVFGGDGRPARCLAWRLQGDYFVAGFDSGQLRLWSSVRSARMRFAFEPQQSQTIEESGYWSSSPRVYAGHKARVNSVAWSPDGVYFASASDDGTVRVWRVDEPADNFQIVLEGHTQPVTRVCFSPTGNLLASKSNDGTVRIWRMAPFQCIAVIDASAAVSGQPPLPSSVLAFHPREPLLAACLESDKTINTLELDLQTLLDTTPQAEVEKAGQARIFISYKRGTEPDEQLVQQVTQALSEQHKIFTDRNILPGEQWIDRIEKELRESDYLIVFLSSQAVQSEMIAMEIRQARELAQRQDGRPKILPVRVAYYEPFPYELGAHLNHIQWAYWDTPSDTQRLIEELKRAISSDELPANVQPDEEPRARIFFAYKRNVEPDEPTARQIAEALSERHDVFIDHKMRMGVDWAEAINEAFGKAEVLIVLLTAESMRSDAVMLYLRRAVERSEARGGPLKIIPVRLAYRDQLPEDLADLDRLPQIIWETPEDTPRVIDEIQQMLVNSTSQSDGPEPANEPAEDSLTQTPVLGAGISIRNRVTGINQPIRQTAWSPDGKTLAATTGETTIYLWDAETGVAKAESPRLLATVKCFAWSPDGRSIAVGLHNQSVFVIRIEPQEIYFSDTFPSTIQSVEWSPTAARIVIATLNNGIYLRDVEGPRKEAIGINNADRVVNCIACSPAGASYLVTGDSQGDVVVWDTQSLKIRRFYKGHTAPVNSVAISPSRAFFTSGSEDGTVRVWRIDEPDEGYQIVLKDHTGPVTRVCFSPNGKLLASKSNDSTIRLWRHPDWKCVAVIDASATVTDEPLVPSTVLAFHPSKPLLATCVESDKTISILEIEEEDSFDPILNEETQQVSRRRIFVSYENGTSSEQSAIHEIIRELSKYYDVTQNRNVLAVGDVLNAKTQQLIRRSEVVIVFLTQQSVRHQFFLREIEFSLKRAKAGQLRIIPIHLTDRHLLPDRIANLSQAQQLIWNNLDEMPRLISELQRTIEAQAS